MGATPFFATATLFPDWRFENLEDKDLLSLHVDDFWGVPWEQCNASGCTPPEAWVTQWANFANEAKSKGKTLYLATSPLGARKTLAARLDVNGNKIENWAPVDASGCYTFATDANVETYKTAYISYVKYLIDLVDPLYVSPAVEMNIPFSQCASQKAAWIAWYSDVHNAIKTAYPSLVVFPTFQMEHMYGISDPQAACIAGTALAACFDQRLSEALTIPGDRIAFSTYPIGWKYLPDYSFSFPTDTYARVKSATARKIWIAETGWAAVKVLQSYSHSGTESCGMDLFPASIANNTEQDDYLRWLLTESQAQEFEAVIWWLNRDYLDGAAAATCPCDPVTSDTCVLADIFYSAGGVTGETLLRIFGNMALRNYDGSPRPARTAWREHFDLTLSPN
ncbi:MAG TPA: hypothetical protein VIM41_01945 [Gammaproteobacteria bacterium]